MISKHPVTVGNCNSVLDSLLLHNENVQLHLYPNHYTGSSTLTDMSINLLLVQIYSSSCVLNHSLTWTNLAAANS